MPWLMCAATTSTAQAACAYNQTFTSWTLQATCISGSFVSPSYLPAKTSLALVKPHSLRMRHRQQHTGSDKSDTICHLQFVAPRCSTRTTTPRLHRPAPRCVQQTSLTGAQWTPWDAHAQLLPAEPADMQGKLSQLHSRQHCQVHVTTIGSRCCCIAMANAGVPLPCCVDGKVPHT